jgi:hypothetical protein
MWRRTESGTLLRVFYNEPADFFVRRFEDDSTRGDAVTELNDRFMLDHKAKLESAGAGRSIADDWHRIDGVSRKWVLLKPDSAAKGVIISGRRPLVFLEIQPPGFYEYPDEWRPLLRIKSEKDGIATLSASADDLARASEASAAAVDAALGSGPADV